MFFQPESYFIQNGNIYGVAGDDEFAGIGSFFKKIVKTVAPVAVGFIPGVGGIASAGLSAVLGGSGGGGGNSSGVAKSAAEITQFGDEIVNNLRQIKAGMTAANADESCVQADELNGYFWNPAKIKIPSKGKEKAAYDNARNTAQPLVDEIKVLSNKVKREAVDREAAEVAQNQALQSQGFVQLASGQFVQMPSAANNGIDTKTLLFAILGLGALMAVTR